MQLFVNYFDGNPGGDQGDGTVSIPRCPKCHETFYGPEQMRQHVDWENEKDKNKWKRA